MKPAAFDYARASDASDAAKRLAASAGGGKVLAGGQSLGPTLNLRLARPGLLVDIKRAGLRTVAGDKDVVAIGAAWTHAEIEDGVVEDPAAGMLGHVAHGIAYRAVRNRGTLGGSLAHADPAADWVSTMTTLGAVMVIAGPGGTRRVPAEQFMLGAFTTVLKDDEVLASVEVPRLGTDARWGYYKICRKTGEFAKAIGAVVLDPARGFCRVVAGATAGAPMLLPDTAAALAAGGVDAATKLVAGEVEARLAHLDAAARRQHAVAVTRALAQLNGEGAGR